METKGMKQIGKGAFSTVYRMNKHKVLIKSCCNAKECMSMGWFPETPLFPTLERIGTSDCGEFFFYTEKYYEKVRSLKYNLTAFEYGFYKELKELFFSFVMPENKHNLIDAWREQFAKLPNKYHHKRRMLMEAVDAMGNYGSDVCFEISPRNVAVQGKKLVLIDCFFMHSQNEKIKQERMQKQQKYWY